MVKLAEFACAALGEDDPLVRELIEMELHIARGDPGYRGRYIGERLRAIRDLLDRRVGKPPQPLDHKHKGDPTAPIRLVFEEPGDGDPPEGS